MDRSFLSLTPVIQASRRFVCIRTLTYESPEEREFQRALFVGRSGDVENTTFCVLSPDGKQPITRAGRGVRQIFQSPDQMAEWMGKAADYYDDERKKAGEKAVASTALPLSDSVRLGLNTAMADDLPLVVVYGATREAAARLEQAAAELAWKPEFIGKFAYASSEKAAELTSIDPAAKPGLLVVQPDRFGLAGKVLARIEAGAVGAAAEKLAETLRKGLQAYRPRALFGWEYLRAGQSAGAFWETRLPVTDFQEAQARERTRRFSAPPNP